MQEDQPSQPLLPCSVNEQRIKTLEAAVLKLQEHGAAHERRLADNDLLLWGNSSMNIKSLPKQLEELTDSINRIDERMSDIVGVAQSAAAAARWIAGGGLTALIGTAVLLWQLFGG